MYPFQNPELTPAERVQDLLSRLTIEEKIGLLATHNLPVERLGIGEWYVGHEIARGLVNREAENPTTVFPQPIGMAASFDKEMMREIGRTAGREARAYNNERPQGGLMVWGPTVDLTRDPRWGRNEECYGEDPCLTGAMAAEYTLGLRGDGKVWNTIPTLKHFCANNHEEERGVDNADLDPRLRHEYYYAAFRTPIRDGGAHSVMTAYNEICHAPAAMNHDLRDVLKKDWGLGFVVTDGADFSQNVTAHKTYTSHAMALKACLNAGTDTMTDVDGCVHAAARKALADGLITEADLDEAIGNLLESRVLLGHFDAENPFSHLTREDVNTDADKALNLRAAREGMVLLNNSQELLPLDPQAYRKIGLFGQNADVNLMDWYTGTSSYLVSIRKALEERGCEVVYDIGWDIVKLQAPDGKYICIGEDDCLYADADFENAAEFYSCEHDDDLKWTNLRHVQSGRFLTLEGGVPHLGKTEVYGWYTSETLQQQYPDRLTGCVISDYLHGSQLTLDKNGRVVCRPKARPDASVMFLMETVSNGRERISELAKSCDAVIY
ncbi:MAG: glycoside hydrolase family 3 C-terminal domain-containing protein, partial [Oscillospiraceae bacterium]|nr:glycoside hydrolase family 3 C-terminal domain-containing protein [Oscillospiraceae bacterium]